jgi:hypothetical protein
MSHSPATDRFAVSALMVISFFCLCSAQAENSEGADASCNRSKNLARINCGAHIDRVLPGGRTISVIAAGDKNESPAALVLEDNTLSCPLPQGETVFIITLSKIAALERFAFINQNATAQGDLKLSVSNYKLEANDPRWVSVGTRTRFTGKRLFNLPTLGVEAKYVKLSFQVQKEGRLAGLALYGEPTLENFAALHTWAVMTSYAIASTRLVARPEDTLNFNFTNQYARARVVYVSSGPLSAAGRMIDDDVITSFRFGSRDERPTVIIELAESETLHRVSALYQMNGGRVDVYLLNRWTNDPRELETLKPVASVVDQSGGGQTAVDFEPHGARYVALRWTRENSGDEPFEVGEIGAFGIVPLSVFNLGEVPTAFANGSLRFTGQSNPDFSNTLGTLADPPILAAVSP